MNIMRKLLIEAAVAACVAALPLAAAAIYPVAAYPEVRTEIGFRLFSGAEILEGERAWHALAGRDHAAAYRHRIGAPRHWQADWLRREQAGLRDMHAQGLYARPMARLSAAERAAVDRKVREEMGRDSYDAATNTITVSVERGEAIEEAERHYMFLFGDSPSYAKQRSRYALAPNALPTGHERRALAAYFFWSAWSSAAARPAQSAHRKQE